MSPQTAFPLPAPHLSLPGKPSALSLAMLALVIHRRSLPEFLSLTQHACVEYLQRGYNDKLGLASALEAVAIW